MTRSTSSGFTLIELLVVIGIIGVLASVVLTSIAPAREKARDSRRLQDMGTIKNALELYFAEHKMYPQTRAQTGSDSCGTNWCVLETALQPYVNPLPRDPVGDTTYAYYYDSNSGDNYQTYGLMMRPESPDNQLAANDGGYYTLFYETGVQPRYCMSKYGDLDARWYPTTPSSANVCFGGN